MKDTDGKINITDLKTTHSYWRFNMKIITKIGTLTVLFLLAVGVLWAGEITGGMSRVFISLKTYADGDYATAYDVNQNFAVVREEVNKNDTRISTLEGTGGITSAQILDGSVTAADLASSSVYSAEIANSTITNTDIANNTITAAKIFDEPGFATKTPGSFTLASGNSIQNATSVTINCPTSGYVLVLVSCYARIGHSINNNDMIRMSIDTTPTALGFLHNIGYPSGSPVGNYYSSVNLHRTFTVGSGNRTFYFNAQNYYNTSSSFMLYWMHITAIFFPTTYP